METTENESTEMLLKQPTAKNATDEPVAKISKISVVPRDFLGRRITGKPRDFLVPSVIACWFCFWPLGNFAVIYSLKARALYSDGNIEEAHAASRTAMLLWMSSVGIGVGFLCAVLIVRFVHAYLN